MDYYTAALYLELKTLAFLSVGLSIMLLRKEALHEIKKKEVKGVRAKLFTSFNVISNMDRTKLFEILFVPIEVIINVMFPFDVAFLMFFTMGVHIMYGYLPISYLIVRSIISLNLIYYINGW